jgi:PIN domain nuclease of toxin-antitoxin system
VNRLLLDTNVFLWLQTDPDRVAQERERLLDPAVSLFLSAASAWEIAIKYNLGKLPLPQPPLRYVPEYVRKIGASSLVINESEALTAGALPRLHGDPFDRLLVAQAQMRELTIVTGDPRITGYDVQTILV